MADRQKRRPRQYGSIFVAYHSLVDERRPTQALLIASSHITQPEVGIKLNIVQQIDLVPTLAALYGLPIPK